MIKHIALLFIFLVSLNGEDKSDDNELIKAAFRLDYNSIESIIRKNPDVINKTFGHYDQDAFRDPWTLGYSSIGSDKWTALMAVCSSDRYPDPEHPVENTSESLDNARKIRSEIPKNIIAERDALRIKIVTLLKENGANLDLDDGYGATALYDSIYSGFDNVAMYLIEQGAKVNTNTGIYIDGDGGITPLHRAIGREELIQCLLKHGANKTAKTTSGKTAFDWATSMGYSNGIDLLRP